LSLLVALTADDWSPTVPVDHLLPADYRVYVFHGGVVNHPVPGGHPVVLPTANRYGGPDGGYIACYSHRAQGSVYPVGRDIYVMGQVRLRGEYDGRIFQPEGYRGRDISAAPKFGQICREAIAACGSGGCWAGGDTGGWFGVQ
jgi:hypothetical protein